MTISSNERILRFEEVKKMTGMSRSSVHNLVRKNLFPQQVKLVPNGRASGWYLSEIEKYLEGRKASRSHT